MRIAMMVLGITLASLPVATAVAETDEEREMREIQKGLNAEVMAQPFGVEEMAKIDEYIAEAMKKNLVPQPYKGSQPWRQGMTCAHLRGYYYRRNCRYYHRYHGRYYPYY